MIQVKQTIQLGTYYTLDELVILLFELEKNNFITIHNIIDIRKLEELLNG